MCYSNEFVKYIRARYRKSKKKKSDKTAPKMESDMTTSKILTAMKSLHTQHGNLTFLTETSFSLSQAHTHTHTTHALIDRSPKSIQKKTCVSWIDCFDLRTRAPNTFNVCQKTFCVSFLSIFDGICKRQSIYHVIWCVFVY